MESRALELAIKNGRREMQEQWEELRRGWYVGNQAFLERLEGGLIKR